MHLIEFEPDPESLPAAPLDAHVLRVAELSDELSRLVKKRTRLGRSRILGLGFLGAFTVALAWDVGSLFYAGVSAVAWIGIAVLYQRSSVRLKTRIDLIEEELAEPSGSTS